MAKPNNLLAILKTTERCNLACAYCYEGTKRDINMSKEILEKAIDRIAEESLCRSGGSDSSVGIIWHGGEPLLMGTEFYSLALKLQDKYPLVKFENSVQTNLTLLDDKWVDFFLKYGFSVGGSLDGPSWANDISRPTLKGESSTNLVISNLLHAKDRGLNIGVISVIGKHNYLRLPEMYAFFKDKKIDFEANLLTSDGFAKNSGLALSPLEYAHSVNQLFDLWFYDKKEPLLSASSFLKNAITLLTGVAVECTFNGNCRERYISIAPNGDIFPCGRFNSKETPEFKLGNVINDNIGDTKTTCVYHKLKSRDYKNISACNNCQFIDACKGGCPYNALLGNRDINREDSFCEAYKLIFTHIKSRLEEELVKIS